jgi:hydroxyethylthiazole kinase-like uncharacterized protein yjeF
MGKEPLFSRRQAQTFDKFAQEKLGIPSIVLMENAGRSVAEEAIKLLRNAQRAVPAGRQVTRNAYIVIVCGTGNNGGDGLVAARHLINSGVKVKVYLVGSPAKLKDDPKTNLNILLKMGEKVAWVRSVKVLSGIKKSDLIIDALFGIGLNSPVSGLQQAVIEYLNASGVPIVAVDVPSGLDADSGQVLGSAVRARRTVTFVAAKRGFFKNEGPRYCGKIIVRDIGVI